MSEQCIRCTMHSAVIRGYDVAPAELKPTIMAVAKLEVAAIERRRGKRKPKPAGRRPNVGRAS